MSVRQGTGDHSSVTLLPQHDFHPYRRRWYLLATLFLLNLSNAMAWLTFGPVAYKAATFYKTSVDTINWLSIVFMIIGIPFGFVATWLLDTIGIRISVILGSWLNAIGCVLRVVSAVDGISPGAELPLVFIGQTVAALAQPFILFAPTKLSALWFHDDERAISNMLSTVGNPLGIMLSGILSPILAKTASQPDMILMLGVQCIPAGVAMLMATFGWWSNKPPTPPSASAVSDPESFFEGVKDLAKNYQYYLLAWCIGGGIALFSVLTTLLSQILCPWGYTDTYAGTVCVPALIGAGCVGAAIAGIIVDKTKKFIEVTKICYMVAVIGVVVFAVMQNHSGQWVLLAFMCGLFGFFGLPIYPIGNELAVETTYPVGEATSSGVVFILGQLQGILLVVFLQSLGRTVDPSTLPDNKCDSANLGKTPVMDMSVSCYVMAGYAVLLAAMYGLLFHTDYRRLNAEAEIEHEIEEEEAEAQDGVVAHCRHHPESYEPVLPD